MFLGHSAPQCFVLCHLTEGRRASVICQPSRCLLRETDEWGSTHCLITQQQLLSDAVFTAESCDMGSEHWPLETADLGLDLLRHGLTWRLGDWNE